MPEESFGSHGSTPILRVALHVAIFVAAYLVFKLDQGVALGFNPTVDILLWAVAAVGAVANAMWIVYRLGGPPAQGPGGDA